MKVKIKYILTVWVLFLFVVALVSCKQNCVYYERLDLEVAFERGWITTEDLKSIAYYYNRETDEPNFTLVPKTELTVDTEYKLKMSYLNSSGIKDSFPDANEKNIVYFQYYGTYNGFVVARIRDNLLCYDIKTYPHKIIGGVSFYDYISLEVYKTR